MSLQKVGGVNFSQNGSTPLHRKKGVKPFFPQHRRTKKNLRRFSFSSFSEETLQYCQVNNGWVQVSNSLRRRFTNATSVGGGFELGGSKTAVCPRTRRREKYRLCCNNTLSGERRFFYCQKEKKRYQINRVEVTNKIFEIASLNIHAFSMEYCGEGVKTLPQISDFLSFFRKDGESAQGRNKKNSELFFLLLQSKSQHRNVFRGRETQETAASGLEKKHN
jgi:hypothetical protein